jgi:hypothetical protein
MGVEFEYVAIVCRYGWGSVGKRVKFCFVDWAIEEVARASLTRLSGKC